MSAPAVILVRHAAPAIEPAVRPTLWRLSDAGCAAAIALAGRLPPFAAACASTEPKAIETARILAAPHGVAVTSDARFDEHRRETWPFEPDRAALEARVRRALAAPLASVDGAETVADACARFAAALAERQQRPLLVVSHATVLSAWLGPKLGLDAGAMWARVGLPEAFVLDAAGRLLERIG